MTIHPPSFGLQVAEAMGRPRNTFAVVVADVLDADPLRRMGLAFGLVRRGDRGEERQLVPSPCRARSDDRTGGLRAGAPGSRRQRAG